MLPLLPASRPYRYSKNNRRKHDRATQPQCVFITRFRATYGRPLGFPKLDSHLVGQHGIERLNLLAGFSSAIRFIV